MIVHKPQQQPPYRASKIPTAKVPLTADQKHTAPRSGYKQSENRVPTTQPSFQADPKQIRNKVEEMGYTSAKRALQLGNEREMQDLHRAHNIERDALKNFLQKAEKASAEQGRISDALSAKVKSLQVELQKARAESKSLQVELQKARAEVKSSQVESQKANDENQLILDKIVKINKRFSPSAEGSKNTSAR